MSRINVYEHDDYGAKTLVGWFDPRKSIRFDQDTMWDGNNTIGVITRSQWIDEYLYRTPGGRWVLNNDATRYHNGADTYEFITDEQAKDWLLRSECNDKAVEQYFGEIEDERGPGRPEIGPAINVRLGEALQNRVDACAKLDGITRAEWIRKACEAAADKVAGRPYGPDGSPNPYQR